MNLGANLYNSAASKEIEHLMREQYIDTPSRFAIRTLPTDLAIKKWGLDYSLVSKRKKRSTIKTGKFSWPVKGIVSSQYGLRWGRKHEGMDIAAKAGTPIVAARSGRVIFSGRLGGYGNVVILRHSGDYETVYAHNRKNRRARSAGCTR